MLVVNRLVFRSLLVTGLISTLVCGSVTAAIVWKIGVKPSVQLYDLKEDDGVAIANGTLNLVASIHRTKACPTRVERWLWRYVEYKGKTIRAWVALGSPNAPPTQIGDDQYMIMIDLPDSVKEGQWWYYARAVDECEWAFGLFSAEVRSAETGPITVKDQDVLGSSRPVEVTPKTPR